MNTNKIKNNFVYGMGSFFDIFNREHRNCFKLILDEDIKIHSSIYYTGSSFFFRKLTSEAERKKQKLIIKIAGYNLEQLKYEFDESLNEFNVDKFYGIQLWDEIPFNYEKKKINNIELNEIRKYLENLKKNQIIKKTYLQLKLFDFNISEIDEIKFFDGYAFYAYPNEAQLNFSNYDYILKNKKEFLQFQCFGGKYRNNLRDIFFRELDPKISKKEKEKLWINNCLDFSISFFQKNLSFVGCTRQLDRLRYLIDCLKIYTVKKKFDIKFSNKLSFVTKSDETIKSHKKTLKFQRSLLFLFRMHLIRRIKKLFSVLLLK